MIFILANQNRGKILFEVGARFPKRFPRKRRGVGRGLRHHSAPKSLKKSMEDPTRMMEFR